MCYKYGIGFEFLIGVMTKTWYDGYIYYVTLCVGKVRRLQ